jgi:protein-S-isoprenylcysteine O-methyltransferase Ste14
MSKIFGTTLVAVARLIGGSSLLLFCVFLFLGHFVGVDLGLSDVTALGFDAALCFAFFFQHSGMVRKSFQRKVGAVFPGHYFGALYAITSGIVLLLLLLLWQPTHLILFCAHGPLRWILRGAFLLAILGFVWSVRSLSSFDVFGVRPIRAKIYAKTPKAPPLTIRGPYRWVRHPQYFLFLVLVWSHPDLTADRLLLNILWTIWIFLGSVLEERDLASEFGAPYRDYQKQVPMLLPVRLPKRTRQGS